MVNTHRLYSLSRYNLIEATNPVSRVMNGDGAIYIIIGHDGFKTGLCKLRPSEIELHINRL